MFNRKLPMLFLTFGLISASIFAVTEFREYKKEIINSLNAAQQAIENGSRDPLSSAVQLLALVGEMKTQTRIQLNNIPEDVCSNRAFFLREMVEELDILEVRSKARLSASEANRAAACELTGAEKRFESAGRSVIELKRLINAI